MEWGHVGVEAIVLFAAAIAGVRLAAYYAVKEGRESERRAAVRSWYARTLAALRECLAQAKGYREVATWAHGQFRTDTMFTFSEAKDALWTLLSEGQVMLPRDQWSELSADADELLRAASAWDSAILLRASPEKPQAELDALDRLIVELHHMLFGLGERGRLAHGHEPLNQNYRKVLESSREALEAGEPPVIFGAADFSGRPSLIDPSARPPDW